MTQESRTEELLYNMATRPGTKESLANIGRADLWQQVLADSQQHRAEFLSRVEAINQKIKELREGWIHVEDIIIGDDLFSYNCRKHAYTEKNVADFEELVDEMLKEKERCLIWRKYICELLRYRSGKHLLRAILGERVSEVTKPCSYDSDRGVITLLGEDYVLSRPEAFDRFSLAVAEYEYRRFELAWDATGEATDLARLCGIPEMLARNAMTRETQTGILELKERIAELRQRLEEVELE